MKCFHNDDIELHLELFMMIILGRHAMGNSEF